MENLVQVNRANIISFLEFIQNVRSLAEEDKRPSS